MPDVTPANSEHKIKPENIMTITKNALLAAGAPTFQKSSVGHLRPYERVVKIGPHKIKFVLYSAIRSGAKSLSAPIYESMSNNMPGHLGSWSCAHEDQMGDPVRMSTMSQALEVSAYSRESGTRLVFDEIAAEAKRMLEEARPIYLELAATV